MTLVALLALDLVGSTAGATVDAATIIPTPNPAGIGGFNRVRDVSCVSSSWCMAVGSTAVGRAASQNLAMAWNGSEWSEVATPTAGGASAANSLNSTACLSATACFAVGTFFDGAASQLLVLRWDGSAWSQMVSPGAVPSIGGVLNGVSCVASDFCMAVGHSEDLTQTRTLAWNGSTWSTVASPDPAGASDNVLSDVSCASPTSCVAVGRYGALSGAQTLTLRWDGTSWVQEATPNPGGDSQLDELYSVSCASTTRCVAVGYFNNGIAPRSPTSDQNLALQWDGSGWTQMTTPNVAGPAALNRLNSVSCVSPTSCVAVGRWYNGTTSQTAVQIWDGAVWSTLTSPNNGTNAYNSLWGVWCVSIDYCMAVGYYSSGPSAQQTFSMLLAGPPPPSTTSTTIPATTPSTTPVEPDAVPTFAG